MAVLSIASAFYMLSMFDLDENAIVLLGLARFIFVAIFAIIDYLSDKKEWEESVRNYHNGR